MLKNSVIQITTGKLVGVTLLPNTILLISGIIIWHFWRNKQAELQAKTNGLKSEVKQIKAQIAEINAVKNNSPSKYVPPSPSSLTMMPPNKQGLFEFLIEDNIQLRKQP